MDPGEIELLNRRESDLEQRIRADIEWITDNRIREIVREEFAAMRAEAEAAADAARIAAEEATAAAELAAAAAEVAVVAAEEVIAEGEEGEGEGEGEIEEAIEEGEPVVVIENQPLPDSDEIKEILGDPEETPRVPNRNNSWWNRPLVGK